MNELIRIENGEVVADSRMIAEHFGKEHKNVLADIRDEVEKLGEYTELIFQPSEYKDSTGRKLPCYTMGEEGLMQLAARYDAVARRKLILKIKELKQRQNIDLARLSPELQLFKQMFDTLANAQLEQQEIKKEIQDMRDVITLAPEGWRKECGNIVNKIAKKLGGYEYVETVWAEVYKLLDERLGVNVNQRVTNMKKTMALNGVCKSKVDKVNRLDAIANDKKLVDGVLHIVKQIAIKHGVA